MTAHSMIPFLRNRKLELSSNQQTKWEMNHKCPNYRPEQIVLTTQRFAPFLKLFRNLVGKRIESSLKSVDGARRTTQIRGLPLMTTGYGIPRNKK